jgi:hypothetical protein
MGPTFFLLWIYMSHPWHFGPLPLTPGWYSPVVFHDLGSCQAAVDNGRSPAVCLPAGADPPGPLARLTRARAPLPQPEAP